MAPLFALALLGQESISTVDVELPFRTLSFGSNRQIKDGGAIVLRSGAAFDAYRKKMGTSDRKRPTIDWRAEQVIAIHASGNGFGPSSIHVLKVVRKADGTLSIDAALDRGSMPATPTPGVMPVLRKEGLYSLIVVPPVKGEVILRMVDPPASSGDKSGRIGSR